MEETIIERVTEVRRTGSNTKYPFAVRVFRAGPDTVHIQVRGRLGLKTHLFAGANLTRHETERLRDGLDLILQDMRS